MNAKLKTIIASLSLLFISVTTVACKADSKATYTPPKSDIVLNNPLMGWAPDAMYTDYTQPHKLVYANIYLSELEPQKGIYDFDFIEKKYNFDYWKSKDVKIILRLVLDRPNTENKKYIPDWLYKEMNEDGTWYNISYGSGFSPNYENKTLIKYHEEAVEALAKRYNNSPDIAFIALGSIGHWGEWHTYQADDFFIPFPSQEVADIYASHYVEYFDSKKLLMRRPFTVAKENNMGLFNDMLGNKRSTKEYISWINNGYTDWLTKVNQPAMPDFWKTAPSGGEFANGNGGIGFLKDSNIETTLNQIKDTHVTYIGPNCPADRKGRLQENFDKVLKTVGYRYVIDSVKFNDSLNPGDTLELDINMKNEGVAPFYYKWPVNIALISKDKKIVYNTNINQDITTWLPGDINFNTSINLPNDLSSGDYSVAISIIDPATNNPSIKFANDCEIIPNYFRLCDINIK